MNSTIKKSIIDDAISLMQQFINYQGDYLITLSDFNVKEQLKCIFDVGIDIASIKDRIPENDISFKDNTSTQNSIHRYSMLKKLMSKTDLHGSCFISNYGDIIIKDDKNFYLSQDDQHYILVLNNLVLEYSISDPLTYFNNVIHSNPKPIYKSLSDRFISQFESLVPCIIFLDEFPKMPMLFKGRIKSNPKVIQLFQTYRRSLFCMPKSKQVIGYNCFWERLEHLQDTNSTL